MKKFIAPVMLAVALILASCGGSYAKISDVYDKIKSEVKLSEMVEFKDAGDLEKFYGITEDELEEFAGGINSTGVEQEELVLTKASSDSAADEIETALNNRRQAKLNENKNYNPEQAEMIEKCAVERNGRYVFMIISPNNDEINKIIKTELGL
jgi:sorbitol-specific phosphotransferase system component IIBC